MTSKDFVEIETLNSQGEGVRVVFEWLGDRYCHTIYSIGGGNHHAAWRSQPMRSGQPVFQELHEQQTILFLSGASGSIHWSMSVESSEPGSLTFDVAARVAKPPIPEAIGYERLSGEEKLRIAADFPETVVREVGSQIAILHSGASEISTPTTMRWKVTIGASSIQRKGVRRTSKSVENR